MKYKNVSYFKQQIKKEIPNLYLKYGDINFQFIKLNKKIILSEMSLFKIFKLKKKLISIKIIKTYFTVTPPLYEFPVKKL